MDSSDDHLVSLAITKLDLSMALFHVLLESSWTICNGVVIVQILNSLFKQIILFHTKKTGWVFKKGMDVNCDMRFFPKKNNNLNPQQKYQNIHTYIGLNETDLKLQR